MKISIAMATYNGAKHLQAQLDSFIAQTRQPNELVICDDGSVDNTVAILKEFQILAPFAVHIHCNAKNLGYIKNFEQALTRCTGDIIFLSDQDDIWLDQKLLLVSETFEKNPDINVIINDYYVSDQNCEQQLFSKVANAKALGFSEDWFIAGCATAMRAGFLDIALPIPQAIHGHDSWINNLAIYSATRLLINEPLQLYRRHSTNTTANSIVNKKVFIPSFTLLKQYGIKDCRIAWGKEIDSNNLYIKRLKQITATDYHLYLSAQKIQHTIQQFNKQNAAITQRIALFNLGKARRVARIIALWKNGFYQHFEGWKSAIKDILR